MQLDETVTFSHNAVFNVEAGSSNAGINEGDKLSVKDCLYALLLKSANESANALAEHVAGSTEAFADMMNAKAEKIGCEQTYFVTPNGLDEKDEKGWHHTTAEDLARVMKYCIMDSPRKEAFLDLTQTLEYEFTDSTGARQFSCRNHNAFLQMMEGAISGKTGFTSDAGYCYVGALENEGRTYVVALLACGWPNHKDINGRTRKTDDLRNGSFSLSGSEHADGFWKHSSGGGCTAREAHYRESECWNLVPTGKRQTGSQNRSLKKIQKTAVTRKLCGCCFEMMKRLK